MRLKAERQAVILLVTFGSPHRRLQCVATTSRAGCRGGTGCGSPARPPVKANAPYGAGSSLVYAESLGVDNERTRCVYLAWGLMMSQKLACAKGISLCKAVVIRRSKRNGFMQMNPEGLSNIILSAHTYSSSAARRPRVQTSRRGTNSGITQHVADVSGWEGAALSLCHFCICFTFGHVKSTNSFILDFSPRCLPATSSHHSIRDVQLGPQTALQPGLWY